MKWRYIPPFSAPGSIQMAIDTWLLDQCREGLHPPTLRFYTWDPATLSLGYFQKRWPEYWSEITWHGRQLTLVRRPSGGRGVLHHGDLTYSVTGPMSGYSHAEAYMFLCQFLIQGWGNLGLPLKFGSAGRGYHHETNCFRLATNADLVDPNGSKFIGSAQLWRGETVLQHGSMALHPDRDLQALIFGATDSRSKPLQHSLWRNIPPSLSTIIGKLKQAAQRTFKIELNLQPLSPTEWDQIERYIPRTVVESSKKLSQPPHLE